MTAQGWNVLWPWTVIAAFLLFFAALAWWIYERRALQKALARNVAAQAAITGAAIQPVATKVNTNHEFNELLDELLAGQRLVWDRVDDPEEIANGFFGANTSENNVNEVIRTWTSARHSGSADVKVTQPSQIRLLQAEPAIYADPHLLSVRRLDTPHRVVYFRLHEFITRIQRGELSQLGPLGRLLNEHNIGRMNRPKEVAHAAVE